MAKASLPKFSLSTAGTLESPSQDRESYPHPTLKQGTTQEGRNSIYEQLFAYYSNTAFDELKDWARYRRKYGLYKYTRGIFNPYTRLVDFYADHIYPGSLAPDGEHTNGIMSAIPLAFDTPGELRLALGALWRWSNWQVKQSTMVTNGAMTGNCFVEVVDDVPNQKISYKVIFPSFVKDFQLTNDGDLTYYILEYPYYDTGTNTVRSYAKEVTSETTKIYIDGKLETVRVNPYGIIPAVWIKHLDNGSDFGVCALKSSVTKVDELNSMVSHTVDHVHKQIRSPRVVWTDSNVKALFRDEQAIDDSDIDIRGELTLLKGNKGGNTETLVGNLDPATIVPIVVELIKEFEKDFPELTLYERLRDQNIVSSPGAKMMMGDVERRVRRAASNYDAASQKLFSLGMAIGGYRANLPASEGGWTGIDGKLTKRQQLFKPFSLEAYIREELDVTILPRPLIPESSQSEAEELQLRGQGLASLSNTLPLSERLRWLGYTEKQIPAIMAEIKLEQEQEFQRTIATVTAKSSQDQEKN